MTCLAARYPAAACPSPRPSAGAYPGWVGCWRGGMHDRRVLPVLRGIPPFAKALPCQPLSLAPPTHPSRQAAALLEIMQAGEEVEEVIAARRGDIDETMLQVGSVCAGGVTPLSTLMLLIAAHGRGWGQSSSHGLDVWHSLGSLKRLHSTPLACSCCKRASRRHESWSETRRWWAAWSCCCAGGRAQAFPMAARSCAAHNLPNGSAVHQGDARRSCTQLSAAAAHHATHCSSSQPLRTHTRYLLPSGLSRRWSGSVRRPSCAC